MPKMPTNQISVGTRHRKVFGDLDALAASIAAVGLIHPLVINTSDELIVGERRLRAVKQLGWSEVPVIVAANLDDLATALRAERDENTCRLDFTPSEAVSLAAALEPMERAAADQRMKAGKTPSVNFTEGPGDARDKVAAAVGMSAPQLTKAKAVVAAAAAHPEHYGDIAAGMDATGKVAPAYAKLAERAQKPDAPAVKLPHKTPARHASDSQLPPDDTDAVQVSDDPQDAPADDGSQLSRTEYARRLASGTEPLPLQKVEPTAADQRQLAERLNGTDPLLAKHRAINNPNYKGYSVASVRKAVVMVDAIYTLTRGHFSQISTIDLRNQIAELRDVIHAIAPTC